MRLIRTPTWFEAPQTRYPDLPSVVRQVFVSVAEAEDYANSLGISGVYYADRLDIGNLANEYLAQLRDRELVMPLSVSVNPFYFEQRFPDGFADIPALGDAKIILINPQAYYWRDPIRISQRLYQVRVWSTPSPLHVFWHEHAHLLQNERTRGWQLSPDKKTLAEAVSQRAMKNTDEFVAEVYAGLVEGVEYDQDILAYYRRLGGKLP